MYEHAEWITIRISSKLHHELTERGKKSESYNDTIIRLIHEKVVPKQEIV